MEHELMKELDTLQHTIEERMADLKLAETHVTLLQKRIAMLLGAVGQRAVCTGPRCRAEIYWVEHANGRRAPYDLDGANHFSSCPDHEAFRRKG